MLLDNPTASGYMPCLIQRDEDFLRNRNAVGDDPSSLTIGRLIGLVFAPANGTASGISLHPSASMISSGRMPNTPLWSASIEQRFALLRDRWKAERPPAATINRLVRHDAYEQIIEMGKQAKPLVVRLILRELENDVDHWFWALRRITEADPVPVTDRGNLPAMARAWIKWGHSAYDEPSKATTEFSQPPQFATSTHKSMQFTL